MCCDHSVTPFFYGYIIWVGRNANGDRVVGRLIVNFGSSKLSYSSDVISSPSALWLAVIFDRVVWRRPIRLGLNRPFDFFDGYRITPPNLAIKRVNPCQKLLNDNDSIARIHAYPSNRDLWLHHCQVGQ